MLPSVVGAAKHDGGHVLAVQLYNVFSVLLDVLLMDTQIGCYVKHPQYLLLSTDHVPFNADL